MLSERMVRCVRGGVVTRRLPVADGAHALPVPDPGVLRRCLPPQMHGSHLLLALRLVLHLGHLDVHLPADPGGLRPCTGTEIGGGYMCGTLLQPQACI